MINFPKMKIFLKKNEKIVNLIFITIILFNVFSTIFDNRGKYLYKNYWQLYPSIKSTYESSQYMKKDNPGWIPDETVYAYAGGAFLKGINPTYIAAGSAPLGKYFISLSILFTGNENIIIIFFALSSLFLMYILSRQVLHNTSWALLPPVLLSFETFFKSQLIFVPLLDIMQLPFLLAGFYFFNKAENLTGAKKMLNLIFSSLNIGCFMAIKFYLTGFIIIAALYLVLFYKRNMKSLILLTASLPFSILVIMASYFKIFLEGYSIHKFFGIQKWVFLYHQSKFILPFSIWPLILFNKWYVWYGNKPIISDSQWEISWPILQILTLLTFILYILKKIKLEKEILVLIIWSFVYVLSFSAGNISSRYLIIYFPVLYIVSVYIVKYWINLRFSLSKKEKKKKRK